MVVVGYQSSSSILEHHLRKGLGPPSHHRPLTIWPSAVHRLFACIDDRGSYGRTYRSISHHGAQHKVEIRGPVLQPVVDGRARMSRRSDLVNSSNTAFGRSNHHVGMELAACGSGMDSGWPNVLVAPPPHPRFTIHFLAIHPKRPSISYTQRIRRGSGSYGGTGAGNAL